MHEKAFLSDSSGTAWTPVILLDISLRGISFATPERLVSGTMRQLHFTVPGSPTRHRAHIYIVHQSTAGVPSGFRTGAKFESITAEATEQIADFLSRTAMA